jgi:HSP20 family molecular chaperone IbpA
VAARSLRDRLGAAVTSHSAPLPSLSDLPALSPPSAQMMGANDMMSRAISQLQPLRVDIQETPDAYIVKADVPGVSREGVNIEIDDKTNMLHISTSKKEEREESGERGGYRFHRQERTSGSNYRSIRLPQNGSLDRVAANVVNGVLLITVPKRAGGAESGRRRVDVM